MSETTIGQARTKRVALLASQAEFQAGEMGKKVRAWGRMRSPNGPAKAVAYAARWAILLRRAANLAERYAELTTWTKI